MPITHRIAPCLWFDDQAEEAANFYVSIFKNSRIVSVSRYTDVGQETHRRPPGSVMTVAFELDGQPFTALNGGPVFRFNEAISLQVNCETQKDVDFYWDALSKEGDPGAQQCGWLKDRYGLSWQIVSDRAPGTAQGSRLRDGAARDGSDLAHEEDRHRRARARRLRQVRALSCERRRRRKLLGAGLRNDRDRDRLDERVELLAAGQA